MTVRIITAPSVYLVGRQAIDDAELARFLADEGVEQWETDTDVSGQKLVEVAGRLCYQSYAKPRPGGNAAYIGHILEVGHGSVVEHCVFNLIIAGVSRSFTHELVRHRVGWSYSQRSQRFVDEGDVEFVVPPVLEWEIKQANSYISRVTGRPDATARDVSLDMTNRCRPTASEVAGLNWLVVMEQSRLAYVALADYLEHRAERSIPSSLSRKAAREAARSVLPNATETKIFVTANARALRNFIELRASRHADAEIRAVALEILRVMQAEAPDIFGDYRVVEVGDGVKEAVTDYRKV